MSNKQFIKFLMDRYYLQFYIYNLGINQILKDDISSLNINVFFKIQNPLIKKLNNLNIQTNIEKILNILNKYGVYNIKKNDINRAFLLYKYDYIILENNTKIINNEILQNLKYNLISSVKKLINYIKVFDMIDDYCILKLCNRFKRYKKTLDEWQNADQIHLIKLLSETYYNLQIIKDNIIQNRDRKNILLHELKKINNIDNKQSNILKKINNNNGMEIFKNIKPVIIKNNNKLISKNNDNYYWDILKAEISSYPIKINMVKKCIIEIKYIIYNLISKNIDMLTDIEKNINIDYIDNNKIDSHYIIICIDYLFIFVKKLQTYTYIEETNKYHDIIKKSMIEGHKLEYFIPQTLRYLLELFYKIWDDKIKLINGYTKLKNN